LGKTALAAWVILWFALTRDDEQGDWKIPTTASAWRQLTKFLWPEVRKWRRRIKWDQVGRPSFNERTEALALSLKLKTGEAFALTSDDSATIEGAHADCLLYIFDESKTIPDATWDAAEGAFASPESSEVFALAVSTPGPPEGRFYEIHTRSVGFEDWTARHITLKEAVKAGRISQDWADQRKRQWGESSAVYQNRVLGEFASSEEDGVIPLSWVEQANERWREWEDAGKPLPPKMTTVGVDVARAGGDKTVLALRYGLILSELRVYDYADTMRSVGAVVGVLTHGGKAIVDVVGLGAGLFDRLRELKQPAVAFSAGTKTFHRDRSGELGFADLRSAAWWNLRELLQTDDIALPPDDELTGDLTAPKWREMSGGKIKVESKDEIRRRLKRSTDKADGVVQAFADNLVGSGTVLGVASVSVRR